LKQNPKPIEDLVKELPQPLQEEVRCFVESLLETREHKKRGRLSQVWGGALSDYRDRYTSLELQKKALEWRGD